MSSYCCCCCCCCCCWCWCCRCRCQSSSYSRSPKYKGIGAPTATDSDQQSKAKITKKFKFGLQPDVFISADDFGVEPELLTTAQKVAILESQSFQTKSFNPIFPSDKPSSKRNGDVYVAGNTPSQHTLLIHLPANTRFHFNTLYEYTLPNKYSMYHLKLNTSSRSRLPLT